jgi:hypothetical protein
VEAKNTCRPVKKGIGRSYTKRPLKLGFAMSEFDLTPNDVAVHEKPVSPRRYTWIIRIGLFLLHIVLLAAAVSVTPQGYAMQLGADTGSIIFFGTPILWFVLFGWNSRNARLAFCALAVAQTGLIALVGWHFRSEEALLQQVMTEAEQQKQQWATEMSQFRMDALFDVLSGKRPLRAGELEEFRVRANGGRQKAQEVSSELEALVTRAESRLSPRQAADFQRGVESSRPDEEKDMKAVQDYFVEIDKLIGFLIERQEHYRITSSGIEFEIDGDSQTYNARMDAIRDLQKQLLSSLEKAEAARRQMNITH